VGQVDPAASRRKRAVVDRLSGCRGRPAPQCTKPSSFVSLMGDKSNDVADLGWTLRKSMAIRAKMEGALSSTKGSNCGPSSGAAVGQYHPIHHFLLHSSRLSRKKRRTLVRLHSPMSALSRRTSLCERRSWSAEQSLDACTAACLMRNPASCDRFLQPAREARCSFI
jgi:hypothetical protein